MDSHSKFGPTSSLSIADLKDMVNQVHIPSSNASNTALSTVSGTSPTWLLDSACCNHMTDSYHSRVIRNQQNLYPKSYCRSQATAV